jgi:GTP:adenosylcobinamide-phosphate guanylyltransferase
VNILVLAGDRGPDDPLARAAGVAGKTLVPVAGVPMLTRVLKALAAWPRLERICVVAPALEVYDKAIRAAGLSLPCTRVSPRESLCQSVREGLEQFDGVRPVLVVTADHPLIRSAWLDSICASGDDDLSVGLVDHAGVRARLPNSRRTRYRFSDRELGGTNLFLFRTAAADGILEVWARVEQNRKAPWKIVSLLGAGNLVKFLAGRLSSSDAFSALSKRAGLRIGYRLIDDPLSAVDVDSTADLATVEGLLSERGTLPR